MRQRKTKTRVIVVINKNYHIELQMSGNELRLIKTAIIKRVNKPKTRMCTVHRTLQFRASVKQ